MVSGPVVLIAVCVAISYYLGEETWHGLHWMGVHIAHVTMHVVHFLHL